MVKDAIVFLANKKGSSKAAIKKYGIFWQR
jgi:hypothetical protein